MTGVTWPDEADLHSVPPPLEPRHDEPNHGGQPNTALAPRCVQDATEQGREDCDGSPLGPSPIGMLRLSAKRAGHPAQAGAIRVDQKDLGLFGVLEAEDDPLPVG